MQSPLFGNDLSQVYTIKTDSRPNPNKDFKKNHKYKQQTVENLSILWRVFTCCNTKKMERILGLAVWAGGGPLQIQHLIGSFNFTRNRMSLEVRHLEIDNAEGECIWKFKLGSNGLNQIDFLSEEESVRSLFHLGQDMCHQIQSMVDRKKKKTTPRDRVIRKLCEKMLKSLNVSLKVFANDISEPSQEVTKFFNKSQLEEENKARIQRKCQKWVMEAWVSFLRGSGTSSVIIIKKA